MRLPNLSPGVDRRSVSTRREPGLRPSSVLYHVCGAEPICHAQQCSDSNPCPSECTCSGGVCAARK